MSAIRRYIVTQTREVEVSVAGNPVDAAVIANSSFNNTPVYESIVEYNVNDIHASVTRVKETGLDVRLKEH